jgi:hypothetical protein
LEGKTADFWWICRDEMSVGWTKERNGWTVLKKINKK